jgi:hypothetical protein
VKSLKHVVPMLVALTLVGILSGCSKNTTPTGLAPLDQTPPAVPSQITTQIDGVSGRPAIEWAPSASANAAGYEIYQYLPSPENENAYVLVGETDASTSQYGLPWPAEPTTLYYRLRTVSSTGVQSAWSSPVPATVGGVGMSGSGDQPSGDPRRPKEALKDPIVSGE